MAREVDGNRHGLQRFVETNHAMVNKCHPVLEVLSYNVAIIIIIIPRPYLPLSLPATIVVSMSFDRKQQGHSRRSQRKRGQQSSSNLATGTKSEWKPRAKKHEEFAEKAKEVDVVVVEVQDQVLPEAHVDAEPEEPCPRTTIKQGPMISLTCAICDGEVMMAAPGICYYCKKRWHYMGAVCDLLVDSGVVYAADARLPEPPAYPYHQPQQHHHYYPPPHSMSVPEQPAPNPYIHQHHHHPQPDPAQQHRPTIHGYVQDPQDLPSPEFAQVVYPGYGWS